MPPTTGFNGQPSQDFNIDRDPEGGPGQPPMHDFDGPQPGQNRDIDWKHTSGGFENFGNGSFGGISGGSRGNFGASRISAGRSRTRFFNSGRK